MILSDTSRHFYFYFNVSKLIPSNEQILEAEFHIYKLKHQLRTTEHIKDPRHHLLEVRKFTNKSFGFHQLINQQLRHELINDLRYL